MARTIKLTIGAGAAVATVAWALTGMLADNPPQARVTARAETPIPVVLSPVRFESEALALDAVGTSRAAQSITLHAEASGEIKSIHFRAGDPVEQNQLLLELDARDQRLALELAQIRLTDAQRLMDRYRLPGGADAVPINDLQTAETTLELARVERDRAALALEYRFVKVPFSGVIGLTEFDVGDRLTPEDAIATLDDRSSLLVSFDVPEMLLGQLTLGEAIEVAPWQQPHNSIAGQVVDLDSRVDPISRSFAVRAKVPNLDDTLRPGMSFRVALRVPGRSYPSVPEVAVQWGPRGAYIWTVKDGLAQQVPVSIVQRREGKVLVEGALSAGAPVVTEGVQSVREGRPVAAEARQNAS